MTPLPVKWKAKRDSASLALSFADLKFVLQGSSTIVQTGKEQLAQLSGVRIAQLEPTDFQSITTLPVAGAIVPVLA